MQPLPADKIFEGGGVFVEFASSYPVTRSAELVYGHFGWVAVKIHHGTHVLTQNDGALRAHWVRDFHRMGITVCGWGMNEEKPVEEARLVHDLIARYGLDCYIADAENAHMAGDYGGDLARSPAFVSEFRRLRPSFPAALSSYAAAPAPWVLPFMYEPWISGGFEFLPQSYLSITTVYDPEVSMEYAARVGWPKEKVHPTIGIGWSQGLPALNGEQHIGRLVAAAKANAFGYSIFLGETTRRADMLALGKANEEHLLVRAHDLPLPASRRPAEPRQPTPIPAVGGGKGPSAKTGSRAKSAAVRAAERRVASACESSRKAVAAKRAYARKLVAACEDARRSLARQKLIAAKKAKQKPATSRSSSSRG